MITPVKKTRDVDSNWKGQNFSAYDFLKIKHHRKFLSLREKHWQFGNKMNGLRLKANIMLSK